MAAYPVQIDLQLGADALVDILILQWHTPVLNNGGKIPAPVAASKRRLLEQLRDWLVQNFEGHIPQRPLFIVVPELSTPANCDDVLSAIVTGMHRPTVLVAGLEFLPWEEYTAVVQQLPHMPPNSEVWLQGGQNGHVVNTSVIWVRDGGGQIRKYIQPKRHPSNPEVPIIHHGQNVLLFCSTNQGPGHRFNFCTQICSDFVGPTNVTELRRELSQAANNQSLPLEALFLLQCQDDPTVVQFSQGTAAYFAPGVDLIETAAGCVVFANNASARHGKSQAWGQSQLRFRYNQKWPSLAFPSPTFYLSDNGAHDHQAAVMRETGPGLYHLVYKPVYLVSRVPGPAGQQVPFPDEQAYWSPIHGDGFRPQFEPIQAVSHWLNAEWLEGCAELISQVLRGEFPRVVGNVYLPAHGRCIHQWRTFIGDNELNARAATDLYFYCWKDQTDYPSKCREPKKWRLLTASLGVKRLMKTCALLDLALEAHTHIRVTWAPEATIHAVVGGQMTIAFLWGAGSKPAPVMITEYRGLQHNIGIGGLLTPVSLIILIDPVGPVPAGLQEQQITTAAPAPGYGQHLQPQGGVVAAAHAHRQVYLNDNDLYGPLYEATTAAELTARLAQILANRGL